MLRETEKDVKTGIEVYSIAGSSLSSPYTKSVGLILTSKTLLMLRKSAPIKIGPTSKIWNPKCIKISMKEKVAWPSKNISCITKGFANTILSITIMLQMRKP